MQTSSLVIEMNTLVMVMSFIITAGGCGTVIWKLLKPIRNLATDVKQIKKESSEHEAEIQQILRRQQVMGEATWTVLAHLADGNHTGEMRKAMNKLSMELMFPGGNGNGS